MSLETLSEAVDWMRGIEEQLSTKWPAELPPESSDGFWEFVCKMEMGNRAAMSQKIARLLSTGTPDLVMTDLDQWFFRRRLEFAGQLCVAAIQRQVVPGDSVREVLHQLLIVSWEAAGCVAFWNHAIERGGRPHPENLDGSTPLG